MKGKLANAKSSCIVATKSAALDVECIALLFQWNLDNGDDDELYVIMNDWKNLTFLSYEFGKGQYTFYPVKLSRFLEKK